MVGQVKRRLTFALQFGENQIHLKPNLLLDLILASLIHCLYAGSLMPIPILQCLYSCIESNKKIVM